MAVQQIIAMARCASEIASSNGEAQLVATD
jgi:hypothetical protein